MKKLIFAFILLSHQLFADQRDENEIVWIDDDGPIMSKAISAARDSLDRFLEIYRSPEVGMSDFKLKVRIEDNAGVEHFWVMPFSETSKGFQGRVANEPRVVHSVTFNQLIEFDRTMVSDWGYLEEGKQIGSYTICALFKSMPQDQVEYYRENHGFVC